MLRLSSIFFIILFCVVNVSYADNDKHEYKKHRPYKKFGKPFKKLQTQIHNLQEQIDNIQLKPGPAGSQGDQGPQGEPGVTGLAGKRCPTGLAVVGFDANSNLICEAPWNVPTGGGPPPTGISFNCIQNYDQAVTENLILTRIQEVIASLETTSIPDIAEPEYQITFNPIQFNGATTVSAPIVELVEAEPCQDGIRLISSSPDIIVTGTWTVSVVGLSVTGSYQLIINGLIIQTLANLSSPDLSIVNSGDLIDRNIESVSNVSTSYSSINLNFDDGGVFGDLLNFYGDLIRNSVVSSSLDVINNEIVQQLEAEAATIPAPVTIEVIITP